MPAGRVGRRKARYADLASGTVNRGPRDGTNASGTSRYLVAHAGYQAISRKPERAFMHDWYAQYLLGPARAKGREIDVSESLLYELSWPSTRRSASISCTSVLCWRTDRGGTRAQATAGFLAG